MYIYSLENTKISIDSNFFDLFYPMLSDNYDLLSFGEYKVESSREMRMDLISMDIYGDTKHVDELLYLNGIVDPYSVKMNDIIYYANNINIIRTSYKNENLSTKIDYVITGTTSIVVNDVFANNPTLAPNGYKSMIVDTDNNEIIITNKLS
jgi:hypothetical protein